MKDYFGKDMSIDRRKARYRRRRRARRKRFMICFVSLLVISGIIAGVCSLFGVFKKKDSHKGQKGAQSAPYVSEEGKEQGENGSIDENKPIDENETIDENKSTDETEWQEALQDYDYDSPVPVSSAVEKDYFDDAVFIGDSRTEGLIMNMGLSNVTAYTHKGLMVDTVFTNPVINKDGTKLSVMDALRTTSFHKVYIMLGINETGWPYNNVFIEKYGEIIDEIRKINPSAIIYVQEILPVSDKVSSTHSYIKNEKIKEYNELIKQMASEKQIFFIDTSLAVANSEGSLPEEAATDGIHLKKEYCQKWLDYLKTHTVP